ncbi:MAG: TIR domain-containing protein, partial [Planctomycetaceae bacterium]|nr:TIR domain-containing protein [Planctomycetaceae bacterium]
RSEERYLRFHIPKRNGGLRVIYSPRRELKAIQERFSRLLVGIYNPPGPAHGFTAARSILTNAIPHVRCRCVLNVDLEDFFPSINFGRIRGLFKSLGVPESGATVMAQLCCHDGILPQGAPTSPVLSNMVCLSLDRKLVKLAAVHRCRYTRYADDITFSHKHQILPSELAYVDDKGEPVVGHELYRAIKESGFEVNVKKVRLFDNRHRQEVTGLTVNEKPNVPRRLIRQIRAMIHAWRKHGEAAAEEEHFHCYYRRVGRRSPTNSFRDVLVGKMHFVRMIKGADDRTYRNLQRQLAHVYPEYLAVMQKENLTLKKRHLFICHASEDKESFVRPLVDQLLLRGVSVWYDEYELTVGDNLREKIDEGLKSSLYAAAVLSTSFFGDKKTWTTREIGGVTALEDADLRPRMLPIWYNLRQSEVANYAPTLAGIVALSSPRQTIEEIADELAKKVLKK